MLARMAASCSVVKMQRRNIAPSVGPLVTSKEQTRLMTVRRRIVKFLGVFLYWKNTHRTLDLAVSDAGLASGV